MRCDFTFKVCLFASKDVGKNTLARKILDKTFDMNEGMTIGVEFYFKEVEIEGQIIKLQFWIPLNKKQFRFLEPTYILGSNGIILMYDITNAESLSRVSEWSQMIKNKIEYDMPILLVGNKLDLVENREVSKEDVEKVKEKHDISSSMEISLKTGENVEELFKKLARMMVKQIEEAKVLKIEKKYRKRKMKEKKKIK